MKKYIILVFFDELTPEAFKIVDFAYKEILSTNIVGQLKPIIARLNKAQKFYALLELNKAQLTSNGNTYDDYNYIQPLVLSNLYQGEYAHKLIPKVQKYLKKNLGIDSIGFAEYQRLLNTYTKTANVYMKKTGEIFQIQNF